MIESPRPEAVRNHPRAPWFATGVVCFGAFMGQLDASIVTLTFRPMEREFHAPLAAVQWVSLAYLLALVGLLAPVGRLSDARGRKLIYSYGFVVFTIASAACGLAPSLSVLVAFRIVQALGAAMLQANSVALVTTSVPRHRMRLALGVQAAAQSVGLALGPSLGGLLTTGLGWRTVYWINVPVGCLAVVAGRYLLPRTRQFNRTDSFDWQGTLLLAAATSGLLLVMSAAGGLRMPGWAVAIFLTAAVGGTAGFFLRESRARFPVIPAALLRNAKLALALAGALCGYLVLFGPLVLIPQLLGDAGSEARIGLLLSALPAGFGLAALSADRVLPPAMGNSLRGALGALLAAAALAMLIAVPLTGAWVAVLLAAAGLGLGMFIPANNTVIMRSAGSGSAASLGGLVNIARGIGTTLGIALMTIALSAFPGKAPPGGALARAAAGTAQTMGSRLAFAVLAAVALAGAATALAGGREAGHGEPPGGEGATGAFS